MIQPIDLDVVEVGGEAGAAHRDQADAGWMPSVCVQVPPWSQVGAVAAGVGAYSSPRRTGSCAGRSAARSSRREGRPPCCRSAGSRRAPGRALWRTRSGGFHRSRRGQLDEIVVVAVDDQARLDVVEAAALRRHVEPDASFPPCSCRGAGSVSTEALLLSSNRSASWVSKRKVAARQRRRCLDTGWRTQVHWGLRVAPLNSSDSRAIGAARHRRRWTGRGCSGCAGRAGRRGRAIGVSEAQRRRAPSASRPPSRAGPAAPAAW